MKKAPWTTIKLEEVSGDVGIFVDGDWVESKDQDPKGNTRLTQLADIGVGEFLDRSSRFLTSEKAKELKCTFLKEGDILVARMPDPIGRACIFPGDKHPCVTVVDVCIIRPNPREICNRWLMWMINSPQFKRQLDQYISGTTRQRISRKNLQKLKIPLPPLEEQRRIAAILDKADGVRRKRKEAIRLTEELLKSTFLEMFGDPVTNPKGWEVSPFGSLGKLNRGKSKHRPRNDPSLLGGKYPLIQTGDVANSKGVIKKYTQTYSDKGLAQSRMWPAGTLCITIAANIAQTGILTFDSCFPDSIVGFKPNNRVTTEYIQAWLGFLQPLLEDLAPQSAQKNINLQMLRELDVPVPPIDLQSKFSEFVERIGNNSRNYEKSEAVMDNLFNSLLQRAFRGEL
ncbi:restriction endonuclease subunit S [Microcystis aeruginosa]|jgi:type I restriction enzyme S subunit|uniref:restriction endonuclease subunit S n=1 Tax=Microcystis aeruginosa TaxID=1126 RepID=UPI000468C944|nr:restriction endonuclease subunit S [Microcystis aeruginosa]MDB9395090.1 restriction endonuclease subunit S [Microcystis aeruginosa CS-573]